MHLSFKPFRHRRARLTLCSHRDFVYLWIAHGVSNLGSRVTREALPLTAILLLGASTAQIGILAALNLAPGLFAGFLAGQWIDRLRKRPLMIAMDLSRALVLLSIPVAAAMQFLGVSQLYVVALCMGTLSAFFEIADQSYLPTLLAQKRLTEANSKLATTTALTEASGPALTGALVQSLSAPFAIAFDAASYLISGWSLLCIRRRESAPLPQSTRLLWHGVGAGLAAAFSIPQVRAIYVANAMIAFFAPMFVPLYAYYAINELGMTPLLLGLAISCGGVGALIGAILTPRITREFGTTRTMVAGLGMLGTAQLLVPLAHGNPQMATVWLATAQLLGDGFFVLFLVNELTLRQRTIAPNLLGRANAALPMITGTLAATGIILSGALANTLGVRTMLWISVGGILFACLVFAYLLAFDRRCAASR